jgi:hypothetical protein
VNMGWEDPLLRVLGSPRVRATIEIREVEGERALDGVPVDLRGGGATARPGAVRVVVAGPASLLRSLTPADVRPWVDAADAKAGAPAPVAVELAPGHAGLRVKTISPASVVLAPARPARRPR